MSSCDGCRYSVMRAKRCATCSRQYMDRWEPYPPSKPIDRRKTAALVGMLMLADTLANMAPERYDKER